MTPKIQQDLVSSFGIVERSLLSSLSEFDITITQLPHVLLEGSVQYEVRYILEHYINTGVITLIELKSAFEKIFYRSDKV